MSIAAVVLAAGGSRRMGRPKLLLPAADGRPLLTTAVAAYVEAGLDPVVVVLGAGETEARAVVPFHPRVHLVVNPRWAQGLSHSLVAGLEACGDADAALVTLADLAGQTADRARRVLAAAVPGSPLVVPVTPRGRATHPVLFHRRLWDELRALEGDRGARDVVRRHLAEAVRVELPPLLDVDTEADHQDLLDGRPPGPDDGLELD